MSENGKGVDNDIEIVPYQKALDGGNLWGRNGFGIMFGRGVQDDDAITIEFYRKTCDLGGALPASFWMAWSRMVLPPDDLGRFPHPVMAMPLGYFSTKEISESRGRGVGQPGVRGAER